MNRAACWIGPVWLTLCVLVVAGRATGQGPDAASILYSHGVGAYFDGNASEADQYFTRAIALNPSDPRAYYFRGLSRLQLGRDGDARADLEAGAAAEARQPNRYATGSALQRVQGRERLLLEQYRRQAREEYALQRAEVARARYEQTVRREADVLRHQVAVPLDGLVPAEQARSLLGAPPVAGPNLTPAASVAPAATAATAPPAAAAPASPAAAATAPPAAKAADHPFADETAAAKGGASVPAVSQPKSPPADELFGTPAQKPDDRQAAGPARSTSKPAPDVETETNPFLDEDNLFGP
jgi:hypothetical protein